MRSLGPYELLEPAGAGGMCDVWRATGPGGETVAVKVLRSEFGSELLHDEIHLMTSLYHPGIVAIHRWGDATEAEADAVEVTAGTPWVAMDFADGGSLEMEQIRTYAEFQRLAFSLLDALMHSHARGVIHRDIKPGNILVDGDPAHYMLSDFGIAFPKSRVREGTYEVPMAAAGTMNYIAPEQLIGRWRDFNSYTDLFSLGVVLFELATGELPFCGRSRVDVALAHQRGMRWPGSTRFSVPAGFVDWLSRLLAHDPGDRFAFAADAAHSLMMLGSPGEELADRAEGVFDHAPTIPDGWATTALARSTKAGRSMRAGIHLGGPRPPVPDDWRPPWWNDDHNAMRAAGATAAMFGREAERDELWRRLRTVIETSSSQSIVIRAHDGLGASRLARWLCCRAHEVGAADDIFVWRRHGPSALADTLRHVFRLGGLDGRDRQERLREMLGGVGIDLELVSQLTLGLPLAVEDQLHVVEHVIAHFSERRPLIIWVEDAQNDLELLEIATQVTGTPHPVLFVLTTREESLPRMPYERKQLETLLQSEAATELRLGPMHEDALRRLVAVRFDLDHHVVNELLRAGHGNPLHILQHGALLARGSAFQFGSLADIWLQHLTMLQPDQRRALAAAAVLGGAIHLELWSRLCRRCEIPHHSRQADEFVQAGLWSATSHGYVFAHETLRDAVVQLPDLADEVREYHAQAATLYSTQFAAVAPFRAHHLVSAGSHVEAAQVTYQAIFAFHGEARTAHARSVTEWFGRALDRQRVPLDHPARRWAALMRAYQPHEEGLSDDAYEAVCAFIETDDGRDPTFLAEALRNKSYLETSIGKSQLAADTAAQALALVDQVAPPFVAGLHSRFGRSLFLLGHAGEAAKHFETAAKATHTAPLVRVASQVGWAHALIELDRMDEARQLLGSTVELARGAGIRLNLAHALNALADAERRQGDVESARQHYEEVYRIVRRSDRGASEVVRLNLALVKMPTDPDAAVQLAEEVSSSTSIPLLRRYAAAVRAVGAAHQLDAEAWDRSLRTADEILSVELSEVWCAAAEAWIGGGDFDRARQGLELAHRSLKGIEHEAARCLRDEIEQRRQDLD